jgi:hypothetical protein
VVQHCAHHTKAELIERHHYLRPGSGRSQSALSGAIRCERGIRACLFVVVLAGVEDGGARWVAEDDKEDKISSWHARTSRSVKTA